jgi:hypothetical protein
MEEKEHELLCLATVSRCREAESLDCILKWYKEANLVEHAKDVLVKYIPKNAEFLTYQTVLYLHKFFQVHEIDTVSLLKYELLNILTSAVSADDLVALESLIRLFFKNSGFSLRGASARSTQSILMAVQFGYIGVLHYLLELYMESKTLNLQMLIVVLASQETSKEASQLIFASAEALGVGSRVKLLKSLSGMQKWRIFKTQSDTEILSTLESNGDEIIRSAKDQRTYHQQIRNTIPFVEAFCAQTTDERVNLATVYRLGFFPLEIRTKIASFMLGQEIVIPDEIAC